MRGVRFAPSPTGRFHVGNLRSAWVSELFARTLKEPWVVRFEDIDEPRVVHGAREQQVSDLAILGLRPDTVLIQSARRSRHWTAFLEAWKQGQIYPCFCSRKEIREALERSASAAHDEASEYTGACRNRTDLPSVAFPSIAWRFKTGDDNGHKDFIVARTRPIRSRGEAPDESSFVPAYHWACALDDHDGNYRLIVRAWDLEPALFAQRAIQEWLCAREGRPAEYPAAFHTALVVGNDGHRLEKRTRGVTLHELLGSDGRKGFRVEDIVGKFDDSFDRSRLIPPAPGEIFGEKKRLLTLTELGLSVSAP